MSVYQELGVKPIINAAGTYTILGGSRMEEKTLRAMREAAAEFVPIRELQAAVHSAIARLTRNEAAYVSNGAATGLYLAIAAAVELKAGKRFYYLSQERIQRMNVVMFKAHRNPYDLVISNLGIQYRELSFPNTIFPPTAEDLINALDENTAAIYYAASGWVAPGFLPLKQVLEIAAEHAVPVIVDAAAQLPPAENLWKYTKMGAAAALFSGGKDLHGPQASGLMVGSRAFLDVVTSIGFPNYGIGRMMKVGREELAGLYAAVKEYCAKDHVARARWCEEQVAKVVEALADSAALRAQRSYPNEAGQPIPRAFVGLLDADCDAACLRAFLQESDPPIYAYSEEKHGVFINPMSLREDEIDIVIGRLRQFGRGV